MVSAFCVAKGDSEAIASLQVPQLAFKEKSILNARAFRMLFLLYLELFYAKGYVLDCSFHSLIDVRKTLGLFKDFL